MKDPAFEEIKFFSPGSRINRLRYWAHSMLVAIPFYIVVGIGAFLAFKISAIFWGVVLVAYIALIAFSFILIIQRLHDLDKSGWLSLLALVPLANIYLLVLLTFFKGTEGRNTYGLPTPPNKTWHWILALAFPLIFVVIGIVSAVAIPVYQHYVLGVQQEQIQDFDSSDEAVDGEKFLDGDDGMDDVENLDDESIDEENLEEGESGDDSLKDDTVIDPAEASSPDAIK